VRFHTFCLLNAGEDDRGYFVREFAQFLDFENLGLVKLGEVLVKNSLDELLDGDVF